MLPCERLGPISPTPSTLLLPTRCALQPASRSQRMRRVQNGRRDQILTSSSSGASSHRRFPLACSAVYRVQLQAGPIACPIVPSPRPAAVARPPLVSPRLKDQRRQGTEAQEETIQVAATPHRSSSQSLTLLRSAQMKVPSSVSPAVTVFSSPSERVVPKGSCVPSRAPPEWRVFAEALAPCHLPCRSASPMQVAMLAVEKAGMLDHRDDSQQSEEAAYA